MSMLAEVKRKNKLTLNPRGTLWTNDEGKFGQKLLEKMGWAKGKGLGKEEQGLREPLRIAANSDQKGVGYKENAEEWLKHYDAFEDVLSNLNSINNPEGKEDDSISTDETSEGNVNSLELQSKNSKNRVHYKMFTRGKDLSRYNDDDLACVLGSKRSSKRKKEEEEKEEEEEEERTEKENKEKIETEIGEMDKSHGLTTVYGGSLKDYFSHKMEELKKKRKEGLLGGGDGTPSHPEKALGAMPATPLPDLEFEPAKTDFSFNVSLQEPFVEIKGSENESPNPDLKTKKKKKKRQREDAEENEKTRKRIKEKSIKLEDSKDFHEKNDNENNVEIEDIRVKEEKKKIKRRKCHSEGNDSGDKENKKVSEELTCKKKIKENESIEGGENEIENERKKKKKKKKSKKNRCNENEENVFVAKENEENENKETKHNEMNRSYVTATHIDEKRKKKKKRDKNEDNNEENNSSEKPLKKLRRLTSEMSLELFKGNATTKSETQDRNGDANEENTSLLHHQPDNQERENGIKPKKKLTSKKSFKELKTDLEVKLKQKIKKKDKKRLDDIKENEEKCVDGNVEDRTTGSEPNIMTLIVPQRKICRQNVYERFMKYPPSKLVTCNLDEVYPGSNLASIKGYDRK